MFVSLMTDSLESRFKKSKPFILPRQISIFFFHSKHGESCLSTWGFLFLFFFVLTSLCVFFFI